MTKLRVDPASKNADDVLRQRAPMHVPPFRDFNLRMFQRGDKFWLECSQAFEPFSEKVELVLPLDIDEMMHRATTDRFDRDARTDFGKALFRAIFPRPILDTWTRYAARTDQNSTLRLRLCIQDSRLAAIPWEMIYDPDYQYHLALHRQRPIVRYADVPQKSWRSESSSPLNVLVVASVPNDLDNLDIEAEIRAFESGIAQLRSTGKVGQVDIVRGANVADLRKRLSKNYHVLHYIGHGDTEDEVGYLALTDAEGKAHRVNAEQLSYYVRDTSLRLLVLNGCKTATPSQISALLGLAQAAITAGVPAVIGMQGPIRDEAAIAFTEGFYQALADGESLEVSVVNARLKIMDDLDGGIDAVDWAWPVLFSGVSDGMLWDHPTRSEEHVVYRDLSASEHAQETTKHNLPDSVAQFVDRASEAVQILEKLAATNATSVINLTGLEGVGRSALALEMGHHCAQSPPAHPCYFDAIVWVSAEPRHEPQSGLAGNRMSAAWSMGDLYRAIGEVPGYQRLLRTRTEDLPSAVREILNERRFLLILIDVDLNLDSQIIEFLSRLASPSKAIVTSSSRLSVDNLAEIRVPGLTIDDAIELVRWEAQGAQVRAILDADDRQLTELVNLADRLPAVLRWAVARMTDSEKPLEWIVKELRSAPAQITSCLQRTVKELTGPQQRLLMALALYPEPIDPDLAGKIALVGRRDLEPALTRLKDFGLIEREESTSRYKIALQLLRHYARMKLDEDPSLAEEIMSRGAHRMLELVEAYDEADRVRYIESMRRNLVAAASHAVGLGNWECVIDLCQLLQNILYQGGYWNEALQIGEWGFEAADRLQDHKQRASIATSPLGRVHFHQGNYSAAQGWLERSLGIFSLLGDDLGMVGVLRSLGNLMLAKGDLEMAGSLFRKGLVPVLHYLLPTRRVSPGR